MAKFKVDDTRIRFYCPGCFEYHYIPYQGEGICWTYNGDANKPTLTPSIKIEWPANPEALEEFKEWRKTRICHSFVTDGKISFCEDSTHHLSGKTIELSEVKDDYMDYKCFIVEKTGKEKEEAKTYSCDRKDCKLTHHYHIKLYEWKRLDTGELLWIAYDSDLPIGAMYFEQCWDEHENGDKYKGNGQWNNDDGYHLIVIVPTQRSDGSYTGHRWDIDTRASNCTMKEDRIHRCWIRHGELPNITVDKAGFTCSAGAGSILVHGWHGFLQNGVLKEC